VTGKALVFRRDEFGEEVPLEILDAGEMIGEMGYFSDGRRSASVRAQEDTLLFRIFYRDIHKAFELVPQLAVNFLNVVTERLCRANLRFQETVKKTRFSEKSLKILYDFLDITEIINLRMSIEDLIKRVVLTASRIMNADRATLFLVDRAAEQLWSMVAEGEGNREIRIPIDTGIAGWVAQHVSVVNVKEAYDDERFNLAVDQKTGFSTRTVLCAPLLNRDGEIIGVTEVMNKRTGVFEKEDEELLRALTAEISVALENAQLFERTISMKNYLESIHESISNSILTLDNHHQIVTANRAAIKLFRRAPEALLGHDISEVVGTGNDRVLKHIERVYASHLAVVDHDLELALGENLTCSVNLNFVPLIGQEHDYRGLVLVLEDISQEKRLKSTLTRYMARDIVEKVLNDPDRQSLGGVRSKATILFTDIRGFTAIAEKISAEQTVDLLNDCFSVLVDILFKHDGVLDKYIGDSIMAVFGDDVNISQYLEKQNKQYGTGILIAESTKMEVADAFVTRLIDRILFKGKKNPVNVYDVLGEKGYPAHPAPDTFGEAMALYHQCRFREAGVLFALGAGHDPPSRHYQKRCQYFLENPPPPDWDGLWIASEK
jgi:class 3 adenylate cyclase/GAF domain-containing protein